MKQKIPNLRKIIEPEWAHRIGYGFGGSGERKLEILEQGTTPKDSKLLAKLGVVKKD